MGDPRRFHMFANLIEREFPDRTWSIADVAGGKGYLKAALYQLGYRRVTCWDRRRRMARGRPGQRYQLFDYRNAPREYRLVVAMHPDEATDHVILYAGKHRVPCVVCPCCIKPSAETYWGKHCYGAWHEHLKTLARSHGLSIATETMPMSGRNLVMILRPEEKAA